MVVINIYLILSISLNLVMGFTGLLNLSHIALFGVGAYTSALMIMNGYSYLLSLLLAMLLPGVFAVLLMFATRKLKSDYLMLVTFGFSFLLYSIFISWTSLTRGPLGLNNIPKISFFDFTIYSTNQFLVFSTIMAIVSIIIIYNITKSSFGRLLQAVRDDEISLKLLGKNIELIKFKAMFISGLFAGLAGSLFAHYSQYIEPNSFWIVDLIFLLTVLIVGGLASNRGAVFGVIIIMILNESLRLLPIPSEILGPTRQIIYALILILILLYRPKGIFGRIDLK
ncbi:branched-chain amino acid ABC transporter permease [Candidatus Woesearchaeota archaeon]|nr:branched-chain amino acid ABC transporter permease [Candidatus Woesearchaeota archaeon]